jgi:hypothetical protein
MAESANMFRWPDVRAVIPNQRWTRNLRLSPQHRFWSSAHYYLSCRQNSSDGGHEEIISLAESFGVMRQITDFMANITGRNTVATFYGKSESQPTRRAFLCTNRELLLVEMEFYSDWTAEAQANLEAYVAACEAELKRLKTGSF